MYYKSMEIKDQFQISLTGSEYDLLCEVMSFAYSMDFEEHSDDELFNRTWDKISNADHNIQFEEVKSWAQFLNSIQVSLTKDILKEKSESLPRGIPNESPQIGSTDHTRIIWNLCTIFSMDSKSFQDDSEFTFYVPDGFYEITITANDLDEAERQAPPNSELIKVNGDPRF